MATIDHGVPTTDRHLGISDPLSKTQIDALIRNCEEFGITLYGIDDPRQGIVHVIGPEQGITQPGMTDRLRRQPYGHPRRLRCSGFRYRDLGSRACSGHPDSAASQAEEHGSHRRRRPGPGVSAKDVILGIIARIGVAGGVGHVIEYRGEAIRSLSMAGRMTICNMSIEGGARAG